MNDFSKNTAVQHMARKMPLVYIRPMRQDTGHGGSRARGHTLTRSVALYPDICDPYSSSNCVHQKRPCARRLAARSSPQSVAESSAEWEGIVTDRATYSGETYREHLGGDFADISL